jgi:hypothetical protein
MVKETEDIVGELTESNTFGIPQWPGLPMPTTIQTEQPDPRRSRKQAERLTEIAS